MADRTRQETEARLRARLKRADLLGNHYKKNLRNIEEHLPQLLHRLDASGELSLINVDAVSPFCFEEMDLIRCLATDRAEAFDLLGCHYSLLLLTMNLNLMDTLEADIDRHPSRTAAYRAMLLESEARFTRLCSSLIRIFLEMLAETEPNLPEFVICHVGARRDQDDIDVGILHREGGDLKALSRVIGRLNREMYRRATPMDFYLSEHSGAKWFSASIEDYEKLMDVDIKNFVIISQLFGSVPITGSISLFEAFQERVVMRYAYRLGKDNRYYTGFVRGVVEEIRALIAHRPQPGEIVPKADGLRMAKMIVSALRATQGIIGGHFWKAFDAVVQTDKRFPGEYHFLQDAIAFMESTRFLYQLTLVQEEGVRYTDPYCRPGLERVAYLMGYGRGVRGRGTTEFLRDYYRYARRLKEAATVFKEELKQYVDFIRVFKRRMDRDAVEAEWGLPGQSAADVIEIVERSTPAVPWTEFVGFLEEEDVYCRLLFEAMDRLHDIPRPEVLRRYFRSMGGDVESLVRFLLLFLEGPWRADMAQLEACWTVIFIEHFASTPSQVEKLIELFSEDETLCRRFFKSITASFAVELILMVLKSGRTFGDQLIGQVLVYVFLYHYRNPLLKRKIGRLISRGLIHDAEATDVVRVGVLSKRALTSLYGYRDVRVRYQKLADYHDLESLRFFLRGIREGSFPRADYLDRYVRRLVRFALQEAGLHEVLWDRQGVALYSTGGNARGEACKNDYDMFVIFDPDRIDEARLSRAVCRIHSELARLGTMPHHQIGGQLAGFAFSLDALCRYLDERTPVDFVERCQLLGARLVFGGSELHARFEADIIRQRIFAGKETLMADIIREFRAIAACRRETSEVRLKQGRGGLFDMTLLLSLLRAAWEIYEPGDARALQILGRKNPARAPEFKALHWARKYLTDVSGILKLTVNAESISDAVDLRYAVILLGFESPSLLRESVLFQMKRVSGIAERLIRDLER
jgi:hypothetical protein